MSKGKSPEGVKKPKKGKFLLPNDKIPHYALVILGYKNRRATYKLESDMWQEILKQELADTDVESFRKDAHRLIDESCDFFKQFKD